MKFKTVFDAILDFLTASIFEEIDEDKALLIDFEAAKNKIAKRNKEQMINEKLIPFAIHQKLLEDNYLISEKEARRIAENYFLESKQNGNIDELNRLVDKEVI